MLIITLMLSRTFSETLTSISNKDNYETFTKIITFLSHSSGKCRESLTMAALIFIKLNGLCTIFIH